MNGQVMKNYRKKAIQKMRPYILGEDLNGVSVSQEDTPEEGGMIAVGSDNNARWYVSKEFFDLNYEEVGNEEETLVRSFKTMCQESLDIETYEKFEDVEKLLRLNRHRLK